MNELEQRVFIRSFGNKVIYGPDQTFEEWMDSFEKTVQNYHGDKPAVRHLYFKKHSQALKQIEKLYKNHPVLEIFHKSMFETVLREIQTENSNMHPPIGYKKTGGSYPIPSDIAQYLLWGMEISKRETKGYELFRIYYHHALRNDFNLPMRATSDHEKINFNPTGETFNPDVWKFERGFYQNFPSVPPKKPENTNWARSLKQSLNRRMNEKETKYSKGLRKR